MTYQHLEEKFTKYGAIKKCKISLNPDNTPKGFAYVCFEEEEGVKNCLADKENEGTVSVFNQGDQKVGPDMNVT